MAKMIAAMVKLVDKDVMMASVFRASSSSPSAVTRTDPLDAIVASARHRVHLGPRLRMRRQSSVLQDCRAEMATTLTAHRMCEVRSTRSARRAADAEVEYGG